MRRSSSSSPRKSSSSSSSGETKHKSSSRQKKFDHPSFRHMITEAIYHDKKWAKGSSRVDIRRFIDKNYEVDEKRLKSDISSTLAKMIEDSNITKYGEDSYKLTKEWRKEWKTKNGIKAVKRKSRKDKNAPKGARNAYIFFGLDVRKRRQGRYPEKDAKEITKMIGEEWRGLTPNKKKKYEDQAEEDRKRWKREMKAYDKRKREDSSGSEESSRPRSRKKKHSRREESESESKGKKTRKEDSSEESDKKDNESEDKQKKRRSDQGKEAQKK
jgi:hypothetical protein